MSLPVQVLRPLLRHVAQTTVAGALSKIAAQLDLPITDLEMRVVQGPEYVRLLLLMAMEDRAVDFFHPPLLFAKDLLDMAYKGAIPVAEFVVAARRKRIEGRDEAMMQRIDSDTPDHISPIRHEDIVSISLLSWSEWLGE